MIDGAEPRGEPARARLERGTGGAPTHGSPADAAPAGARSPGAAIRGVGVRVGRILRDGWLVVGIALAMLVSLELAYRGYGAVRQAMAHGAEPDGPPHPDAAEPWRAAVAREQPDRGAIRFDAYRGWWPLPRSQTVVNVDSNGLRATPGGAALGSRPIRVFFFGGSTMWGYTVPDSLTIPALVAARLREAGAPDLEVVNYAQTAFNMTQGVATLMLALRDGNIPDAVVFLDGHNDVAPAVQAGRAGGVINEPLMVERWRAGRTGLGGTLAGLARHSELVARLGRAAGRPPIGTPAGGDSIALCDDVARQYGNLARQVRALADEYEFEVVMLWQPVLATTAKPLGPWERAIPERWPGYRAALRTCARRADATMAAHRGTTYFPLHDVFDDAGAADIFIDDLSHFSATGHHIVAARVAEILRPAVARAAARRGAGDRRSPRDLAATGERRTGSRGATLSAR